MLMIRIQWHEVVNFVFLNFIKINSEKRKGFPGPGPYKTSQEVDKGC